MARIGELFTPEEKALLALTEEVTLISQHHASNTTYNAAAALFDEHYLAQAIMAIATVNVWNRIAITQLPVAAETEAARANSARTYAV